MKKLLLDIRAFVTEFGIYVELFLKDTWFIWVIWVAIILLILIGQLK